MALERKVEEKYDPTQDEVLQSFLKFISIPLDQLAQKFLATGSAEDYLLFIRRLEASNKEHQEDLFPLIKNLKERCEEKDDESASYSPGPGPIKPEFKKNSDSFAEGNSAKLPPQIFVLLGHAYEKGIGIERDEKLAAEYYEKGGETGNFSMALLLIKKQKRVNKWAEEKRLTSHECKAYVKLTQALNQEAKDLPDKALSCLSLISQNSSLLPEAKFLMAEIYEYMPNQSPEIVAIRNECILEAKKRGCLRVLDSKIENDDFRQKHRGGGNLFIYSTHLILELENAVKQGYLNEFLLLSRIFHSHGFCENLDLEESKVFGTFSERTYFCKDARRLSASLVRSKIYVEVLAALENSTGTKYLVEYFLDGIGTERDICQAKKWAKSLAEDCFRRETNRWYISGVLRIDMNFYSYQNLQENEITWVYYSLLGFLTCHIEYDNYSSHYIGSILFHSITEIARLLTELITHHEDKVIDLIELQDVPKLQHLFAENQDILNRLNLRCEQKFMAAKTTLRSAYSHFPDKIEDLILKLSGCKLTLFGSVPQRPAVTDNSNNFRVASP